MKHFLTLFALVCAASGSTVPLVEVSGPQVEARDLAEAVGAPSWAASDTVLTQAPLPGVTRRVTRAQLALWARGSGLTTPDAAPEAVLLRRRMRRMSASEVRERIGEAVAADTGQSTDAVEVELGAFAEPEVPAGDLDFSVAGLTKSLNRENRYYLRWQEPHGRSGVVAVEASARVFGRYLEATRDLNAGEDATAGDFAPVDGYIPDARYAYVDSLEALEGKKLRQRLAAGDPLRADQLASRPDVERGAIVELSLDRGPIRLRTAARAEGAGSVGDVIAFRNLETNTRVQGRILSGNEAEVLGR